MGKGELGFTAFFGVWIFCFLYPKIFSAAGFQKDILPSGIHHGIAIRDALFFESIVSLFSTSELTNAPTARTFLCFLGAGETQVIVIEQVTFDIIKALLS